MSGKDESASGNEQLRVFLSYAHDDAALVHRIIDALAKMKVELLWDRDIRPGSIFTESIKEMIERSHLFIPVLTEISAKSAWVHQETGYALALKIPVLPLAIGKLPDEMIAYLQAVTVREDLSDLAEKLQLDSLKVSIMPKPEKPAGAISITEWPETRTDLLVRYAQWVVALGQYGYVRQQAWFSSFSIPDKQIDDPIWMDIDGKTPRGDYYHYLQLQERRVLELHIRQAGGKLIIDPTAELITRGPMARKHRLEILSDFLGSISDPEHFPLRIVMSPSARQANVLIVGNYFAAEGLVWRTSGYYQTVFHSHPTTVLERIKTFDEKYKRLTQVYPELNAKQAKDKIDAILASLPIKPVIESRERIFQQIRRNFLCQIAKFR